jgi:hypothetical protein
VHPAQAATVILDNNDNVLRINNLELNNDAVTYARFTVSGAPEIPVPAAVWLFGSGLLCLVGMARRKKA